MNTPRGRVHPLTTPGIPVHSQLPNQKQCVVVPYNSSMPPYVVDTDCPPQAQGNVGPKNSRYSLHLRPGSPERGDRTLQRDRRRREDDDRQGTQFNRAPTHGRYPPRTPRTPSPEDQYHLRRRRDSPQRDYGRRTPRDNYRCSSRNEPLTIAQRIRIFFREGVKWGQSSKPGADDGRGGPANNPSTNQPRVNRNSGSRGRESDQELHASRYRSRSKSYNRDRHHHQRHRSPSRDPSSHHRHGGGRFHITQQTRSSILNYST